MPIHWRRKGELLNLSFKSKPNLPQRDVERYRLNGVVQKIQDQTEVKVTTKTIVYETPEKASV